MKFKNKLTGKIVEPHAQSLIDSLSKDSRYEEIKEVSNSKNKNKVEDEEI